MSRTIYPSYGALARPAMIFGVPVSAFAIVFLGTTLVTLLSFMFFGGKALFILLLVVPVLLLFRTLCATDDQALSVIGYELMCFIRKRNAKFFNNTFTIVAERQERTTDVVSFFRNQHRKERKL
jgi:type IV secretion system protein VirB3